MTRVLSSRGWSPQILYSMLVVPFFDSDFILFTYWWSTLHSFYWGLEDDFRENDCHDEIVCRGELKKKIEESKVKQSKESIDRLTSTEGSDCWSCLLWRHHLANSRLTCHLRKGKNCLFLERQDLSEMTWQETPLVDQSWDIRQKEKKRLTHNVL